MPKNKTQKKFAIQSKTKSNRCPQSPPWFLNLSIMTTYLSETKLDTSFLVGVFVGYAVSRSGIVGVLSGVFLGILISRASWSGWDPLSCSDSAAAP